MGWNGVVDLFHGEVGEVEFVAVQINVLLLCSSSYIVPFGLCCNGHLCGCRLVVCIDEVDVCFLFVLVVGIYMQAVVDSSPISG